MLWVVVLMGGCGDWWWACGDGGGGGWGWLMLVLMGAVHGQLQTVLSREQGLTM